MKGSEKFWMEARAEALLQLHADHLSDTHPRDGFWQCRTDKTPPAPRYCPRVVKPTETEGAAV